MTVARTNDVWIESHLWRWMQPEEADQRAIAGEAAAGLFAFLAGWIEPIALEARIACYDPEILGEALDAAPPGAPHLMLVRDPVPPGVAAEGAYVDPVVSRVLRVDAPQVDLWLAQALEPPCGAGLETCLAELVVRSLAVALPPAWREVDPLLLDDPVNRLSVPILRHHGAARVAGPPAGRNLYPPLAIALSNQDRELHLRVQVYWSPWEGEAARPDSDLARAAARLESRGWQPDPAG